EEPECQRWQQEAKIWPRNRLKHEQLDRPPCQRIKLTLSPNLGIGVAKPAQQAAGFTYSDLEVRCGALWRLILVHLILDQPAQGVDILLLTQLVDLVLDFAL